MSRQEAAQPRSLSSGDLEGLSLPPHLAERTRSLGADRVRADGDFVLCWLHHAVRGHENPVLDVAVSVGNALGKPVLVYQGLAGQHRFNSDRHHTFILEGTRDLESELARRGLAFVCHIPEDPSAPSPLRGLLHRACAFIAEDYPAPPFPRWTARLAQRSPCRTLLVDGACLMPVRALDRVHTRAFKFRDAAKGHWRGVIDSAWSDVTAEIEPMVPDPASLSFQPVDLTEADIDALCARCDIDHSVPPVMRVRGGSVAGYERWEAFKRGHLSRYDRRRNDAADMEAVSGLSPYLHHGHVSPFRVAREANAAGGKGAEKFLDELLVWRELAFNFCAHTPEERLESLDALPEWARQTLLDHASDARDAVYSWETLSRGATGDALWNAAQRSLLHNGELHNSVRMTWGKAIPPWVRTPTEALRLLVDLNHRYALDGSDPNSYGGLLWCLGQFDRPFEPGRPVLGTVRERSSEVHAERLAPTRFAAAVRARRGFEPMRVAVVGAGISGLACARVLHDQGHEVTVFDRGRGPGGRMSTRRVDGGAHEELSFDHGAPYFEVRDPRFGRYVRSWIESGVCAKWQASSAVWRDGRLTVTGSATPMIVGTPTMSAVCAHLAVDLSLRSSHVVESVGVVDGAWRLALRRAGEQEAEDAGPFDAVVLAMAAEQAKRLIPSGHDDIVRALEGVRHEPVWAGLLMVEGVGDVLPDVLETPGDPVLALVTRNDSKPGRRSANSAVRLAVHAQPAWSHARFDANRDEVADELAVEARRVLGAVLERTVEPSAVTYLAAHRWGMARPAEAAPLPCVFDRDAGFAICGDGFGGSGVEAAFLSGHAAAGRVLSLRRARSACESSHETLFTDDSA